MKFTINDKTKIQQFVAIFSKLRLFTNAVTIYFRDGSIYVQGMDASQIIVFELQLIESWFEEYNNEKNDDSDSSTVSLATDMFANVLKCVDSTSTFIRFEANDDMVHFEVHIDDGKYCKGFKIPTMSDDGTLLDIPESEMPVEVEINTAMLKKFLTEQLNFGDDIAIKCDEENIVFNVEGNGLEMVTSIDIQNVEMYAIEEGSTVSANFNLNMLCKFLEFAKLSSTVNLYVSDEMPLKLMYKLKEDDKPTSDDASDDASEHKGEDEEEEEINNFFAIYMAPKMDD